MKLPEQAKPWFLVIMDTSGSMNDHNLGANTCGFSTDEIGHAKCALNKIITSTGDAEFGLMQFHQTGCNSGGTCNDTANSGLMRVGIAPDNETAILSLVDGVGSCMDVELVPGGSTPLGGSLALAQDYFEGSVPGFPSPTTNDDFLARDCRQVSVILLTDGDETCSGDAPASATALRTTTVQTPDGPKTLDIRTYVIGFGSFTPCYSNLENIATAGGTDAPPGASTDCYAFYAGNEAELSAAFNQIIADAQLAPEICNNLDDNCNGLIDEGIVKYCDRPNGVDGRELCDMPPETECDGVDDNCDGQTDEGLLNACGFCGEVPEEVCDGLDNDCDGSIDEGVEEGTPCGDDTGECKPGVLKCVDGAYVCIDETGPRGEECNCLDDDCDGETDEDPAGDLCPPGQICYQCECVPLCEGDEEFGRCETDRIPKEIEDGRCICIVDRCDPVECAEQTLEADGGVICGPDAGDLPACGCSQGECSGLCYQVECDPGYVCDPVDGRCAANTCAVLGCNEGQRCDMVSGECVKDKCADAECEEDEVCRDGECEPSCAGLADKCREGYHCVRGECVEDECADVECESGEVCDPEEGKCVENACLQAACGAGQTCDPVSGDCVVDPCSLVSCPKDQYCRDGECYWLRRPPEDAGTGETEEVRPEMIFGAGGSGCSCSLAGYPEQTGGAGAAWPAAGLLLLAWMRLQRKKGRSGKGRGRRKGRPRPWAMLEAVSKPLLLALALFLLLLSGCEVEPVCIANCDAGRSTGGGSGSGGGSDEDAGAVDGGDGPAMDGSNDAEDGEPMCEDPQEEICNGRDDDCDGRTDERLTPPEGFCGRAGVCESIVAVCGEAGAWVCRFPDTYELNEKRCDGLDNDCDGEVDEGYPGLGTPCAVGNGACRREGVMVCKANRNGTECSQTAPGAPEEELCDNLDNDCDGEVDETVGNPGSHPNYVKENMVKVTGALTFWIHAYELSRPDATATFQGAVSTRPCAKAGVLPWTNIDYSDAADACASIGLRLCTDAEWQQACSVSGTCGWGYTPASGGNCNSYVTNGSNSCNGGEYVHNVSDPGEWLLPAGYLPECYADHGAAGQVYDLSGNVKEWVEWAGTPQAGTHPLRGGSMNNTADGLRCDFDFTVASDSFAFQNVGFRCCADASYQP